MGIDWTFGHALRLFGIDTILLQIVKSERISLVLAPFHEFQIAEFLCTREFCGVWGTDIGAHGTANNTMDFENVRVGPYSSCNGPTPRIIELLTRI